MFYVLDIIYSVHSNLLLDILYFPGRREGAFSFIYFSFLYFVYFLYAITEFLYAITEFLYALTEFLYAITPIH